MIEFKISVTRFLTRDGFSLISPASFSPTTTFILRCFKDYVSAESLYFEYLLTDEDNFQLRGGRVDLFYASMVDFKLEDGYFIYELQSIDEAEVNYSEMFDIPVWDDTEALVYSKIDSYANPNYQMCWLWLEYMKTVERTTRLNEDYYKRKEQIEKSLQL